METHLAAVKDMFFEPNRDPEGPLWDISLTLFQVGAQLRSLLDMVDDRNYDGDQHHAMIRSTAALLLTVEPELARMAQEAKRRAPVRPGAFPEPPAEARQAA